MGTKHRAKDIDAAVAAARREAKRLATFRHDIRRKTKPGEARTARINEALEPSLEPAREIRRLMGVVGAGGIEGERALHVRGTSDRLKYERHALRRMRR